MEHQDWKTIYLKSKNTKTQNTPTSHNKYNNHNEHKMEKNITDGNMRIAKVDKNKSMTIQQRRLSQGLTQKDLANKLNIPVKTINDIESGKANKNPQIMNKINQFFNNNK